MNQTELTCLFVERVDSQSPHMDVKYGQLIVEQVGPRKTITISLYPRLITTATDRCFVTFEATDTIPFCIPDLIQLIDSLVIDSVSVDNLVDNPVDNPVVDKRHTCRLHSKITLFVEKGHRLALGFTWHDRCYEEAFVINQTNQDAIRAMLISLLEWIQQLKLTHWLLA